MSRRDNVVDGDDAGSDGDNERVLERSPNG
jgi:hypothetical protein